MYIPQAQCCHSGISDQFRLLFFLVEKLMELSGQCVWWPSFNDFSYVFLEANGTQAFQVPHSAQSYIDCQPSHVTSECPWEKPMEEEAWICCSALQGVECADFHAHDWKLRLAYFDLSFVIVSCAGNVKGAGSFIRAWFDGQHTWEELATKTCSICTEYRMLLAWHRR